MLGEAVLSTPQRLLANAERVVLGKHEEIGLVLAALAAQGHVLLEDVPGTAKTILARAIAQTIEGGTFSRIQCTPDLQATDVTGLSIYDQKAREFEFRPGPIFANVVLVDEINRAMPKTQSALLEAMAERQVTLEGSAQPLPDPFLVLATQNPVEYEGTYPLPEAQLDRFLFKAVVRYPEPAEEIAILKAHDKGLPLADVATLAPLEAGALRDARAEIEAVTVEGSILEYIVRVVGESRRSPDVLLGASPRAAVHLLRAAKAAAAIEGRDYVTPDDVKSLVPAVLRHRLVLKAEAEIEGLDADAVVRRILARLDVPR